MLQHSDRLPCEQEAPSPALSFIIVVQAVNVRVSSCYQGALEFAARRFPLVESLMQTKNAARSAVAPQQTMQHNAHGHSAMRQLQAFEHRCAGHPGGLRYTRW